MTNEQRALDGIDILAAAKFADLEAENERLRGAMEQLILGMEYLRMYENSACEAVSLIRSAREALGSASSILNRKEV